MPGIEIRNGGGGTFGRSESFWRNMPFTEQLDSHSAVAFPQMASTSSGTAYPFARQRSVMPRSGLYQSSCFNVRLLGGHLRSLHKQSAVGFVFNHSARPNKPFQRIAAKDAAPAEWRR